LELSRAFRRNGGALPLTAPNCGTQWIEGERSHKATFPLGYNSKCAAWSFVK